MITVYSKPSCVQCVATTRELDRKGIKYDYVDPVSYTHLTLPTKA